MDRSGLVEELVRLLGSGRVVDEYEELLVYDSDGLTINKAVPDVVVLPESTEEVQAIVRLAGKYGSPIVARGAGTGMSGGAVPLRGGIVVSMVRMNSILSVDPRNLRAEVEPGVINQQLNDALRPMGLHYAPDPSSQQSCTLGGNVAENAGGPHTLKYGVTTNHVLGLDMVLSDGRLVQLGGMTEGSLGYDLVGVSVGSEGTFGIVTKVVVKLTRIPEEVKTILAVFDSTEAATKAVSAIIAEGVIPATVEMMDRMTLAAVEDYIHAGYPKDAEAVLLIDVDGFREGVEARTEVVAELCREQGAREVRLAANEEEREKLWLGRKRAFGAFGRISKSYYTLDGVIPRSKLPEVLPKVAEVGRRYGFKIANVFHAGDGNLHPIILFDETEPGQVRKAIEASREILRICVEAGGAISGEHGIGLEKLDMITLTFSPDDLEAMKRVKRAFDPVNLLNPGKVIPDGEELSLPLLRVPEGLRPPRR